MSYVFVVVSRLDSDLLFGIALTMIYVFMYLVSRLEDDLRVFVVGWSLVLKMIHMFYLIYLFCLSSRIGFTFLLYLV